MATTTAMSIASATTTTPMPHSSASGFLALLQEPDIVLKSHALDQLLGCVDTLWHQVAEALPHLEALAEDDALDPKMRQSAAAVASRVFFHLEEPNQALRLALDAGPDHFDVSLLRTSPYVERLTNAALDAYISTRQSSEEEEEGATVEKELDVTQLQQLVHRMLETTCAEGNYGHALGIALEARETNKVKDIITSAKSKGEASFSETLQYAMDAVPRVTLKSFRQQVLAVVAEALEERFSTLKLKSAAVDLVRVQQLLGSASSVSKVFESLLKGSEQDVLLGLQLCFDLVDSGDQAFVQRVAEGLGQAFETSSETKDENWEQAKRVLTGGFSSALALSFLHKNSHADPLIMENLKKALEQRGSSRNSLLHNASVMTHAYLQAGTTNDSFLRDHLEWMKKASNW